jgi:hypothetical protein
VYHFGDRTALLEETLSSHRFAISLNPTNTDILFNAAQVLTSLSEAGAQAAGNHDARSLLEEAVNIFTKCLESQQQEYSQIQAEIAKAQASGEYQEAWEGERQQPTEAQEEDMETGSSHSEAAGDWATVEEPLTPQSILETCTAQLSALTALFGLYDPATDLSSIEKKAQDGLDTATTKIPALIELIDKSPSAKIMDEPKAGPTLSIGSTTAPEEATTTPKDDAILAAAIFQASIADMQYRSGRGTSSEYAEAVERFFSKLTPNTEQNNGADLASINIQSAYADALIELERTLAGNPQHTASSPTFATDTNIQWTALSQAQTILTKLSSAPYTSVLPPSRLADVFIARGDTDLFRFRISLLEGAKSAWVKARPTLVANAGVFYRGARSYAERAGALEIRAMADAKANVAETLKKAASELGVLNESWKGGFDDMARALEQMVQEGMVGQETAEGVLELMQ